MSKYSFEEPIGFHLVKVKGAVKTGTDTPFNPSCFAHLSLKQHAADLSIRRVSFYLSLNRD